MNKLTQRLSALLGSRTFFYVVIGFLVFETLWFVFSAVYPMAFDEDFHFGIIKIYAEHWSPFLSGQPDDADKFGAVARDPSYLYHYLMSFPYRAIALFTHSEVIQVIILRLINVAMFTIGLLLFAKVMLRARVSQALTNVSLAVFVLIPIVPQLAAHINYDNMLMLLLPMLCLVSFTLIEGFEKRKVNAQALLAFIAVSLGISVVKYAALPFVLAATAFLLATLWLRFRGHYKELLPAARTSFRQITLPTLLAFIGLTTIGLTLFIQRYGVNVVSHQALVPSCSQVLSVQQCSQYGPWNRDNMYEQQRDPAFEPKRLTYMRAWLEGMRFRLFFAINGVKSDYTNYRGLPVPVQTATILFVVGLIVTVFWWRHIFRDNTPLAFLAALSGFYIVILWFEGFEAYVRTAEPVAINGRYLLPVLLFIAAVIGRALSLTLRETPRVKAMLATLVIVLFLHGGGVFTFILRSDESWYWSNRVVIGVNNAARKTLAPFIVEGSKRESPFNHY